MKEKPAMLSKKAQVVDTGCGNGIETALDDDEFRLVIQAQATPPDVNYFDKYTYVHIPKFVWNYLLEQELWSRTPPCDMPVPVGGEASLEKVGIRECFLPVIIFRLEERSRTLLTLQKNDPIAREWRRAFTNTVRSLIQHELVDELIWNRKDIPDWVIATTEVLYPPDDNNSL